METSQVIQEVVSQASSWKKNKRKKGGEFFVFLVYFFLKRGSKSFSLTFSQTPTINFSWGG
ncbi:MAG: hypothetical protein I3274_05655 [Candidatus Moeniiplasma glomeromycotorum]|nr:hypothetical protein [Candidatus Moeniiplasma glomeromycotorum]